MMRKNDFGLEGETMKMEARLLKQILSEHYEIDEYGTYVGDLWVDLPQFYKTGETIRDGSLLICGAQDLPEKCMLSCMFLCFGSRPLVKSGKFSGKVLYFPQRDIDAPALFSIVNLIFQKISDWQEKMEQLLKEDGSVEDYVENSLALFQNGIVINDRSLHLLANTKLNLREGKKDISLDREIGRIPEKIISPMLDYFMKNMTVREPFFFKGQKDNPEGMNYCINLYLENSYIGTCTLEENLHPIRESERILFQKFAEYIRRALQKKTTQPGRNAFTIKTVFSDLLEHYPVSRTDLKRTLEILKKKMSVAGLTLGDWCCIVIENTKRDKALPEEYLSASLEELVPYSYAIPFHRQMVWYCMIPREKELEAIVSRVIEPWLKDMNFRAGISDVYPDILASQDYYYEAKAILETGILRYPGQSVYRFEDYILPYMMDHCSGELPWEVTVSRQIRNLQKSDKGQEYIETLRQYLDHECNAAETARSLYLHRSSIMPKIEKIKTFVNLETPEDRLYARICLAVLKQNE